MPPEGFEPIIPANDIRIGHCDGHFMLILKFLFTIQNFSSHNASSVLTVTLVEIFKMLATEGKDVIKHKLI